MTLKIQGQGLIDKYPEIKTAKVKIDQNDSLKIIKLENEEFLENMTDGGGELKGFYDFTGTVRKIEVTIFISHGVQEYVFYLREETPFFIDDKFKQFAWNEETSTLDYDRFDGGFHGTYIFREGYLIDQISLGHNRFEDDQVSIEETFKSECENYLEKIKKRLANKG
ncbi:hypothetical protein GCM10011340_24160 [Roseivirga thermotolerans]|uniref:Uncharacterized protein n=2 Tax=Roseivirga thermotolerans TaxID=1758176 RepID=A0ABQ3I6S5_9BACT|nr:hypothetical protein GCM10011340_24160 [Roseivirga thermotolerans]